MKSNDLQVSMSKRRIKRKLRRGIGILLAALMLFPEGITVSAATKHTFTTQAEYEADQASEQKKIRTTGIILDKEEQENQEEGWSWKKDTDNPLSYTLTLDNVNFQVSDNPPIQLYASQGFPIRNINIVLSGENKLVSTTVLNDSNLYQCTGIYFDAYGMPVKPVVSITGSGSLKAKGAWCGMSIQGSLKADGDTLLSSGFAGEDNLVFQPALPTKDGYIFRGWYTEEGTTFDFTLPIDTDLTLHARWEALPVDVTLQAGSSVSIKENQMLTYGQELLKLEFNPAVFVETQTNTEVPDILKWKNPSDIPKAGNTLAEWVFIPENKDMHKELTGTVAITVAKATPAVSNINIGNKKSTPTPGISSGKERMKNELMLNAKLKVKQTGSKIRAAGEGSCTIYVYAVNGYAKKIKVTLK